MNTDQYVWLLWASAFLIPWALVYWWFDLAENTGFDIESLIFCFGIGGIAAVLYNLLSQKIPQAVGTCARDHVLHRHHYKALATPFVVFIVLYFFPWNPIYPSIIAMFAGALAAILCRPDLKQKTWISGLIFLLYYAIFLAGLEWSAPGYIDRVWNMEALSGITIWFMPIEELLFAIGFGMYWSGVYEHFTWRKLKDGASNTAKV